MKRVLVIDDEPDIQAVVQYCLEDIAGWEVLTANSAKEGLKIAIREKPDAILLDVMMPEIDGLMLLKQFQNYSETKAIPVILLTAKSSLTEPLITPNLPIYGAIAKPFNPLLLPDKVADYLGWTIEP